MPSINEISISSASQMTADIFTNQLILDRVFSYLSSKDVLALSRTRRCVNTMAKSYFRRALNINRRLARFFPNPAAFRALQSRSAATIAPALNFDDSYRGDRLELHVHRPHLVEIGNFLFAAGYAFVPMGRQSPDFEAGTSQLMRFLAPTAKRLDDMAGPVFDTFSFRKASGEGEADVVVQINVNRVTNSAAFRHINLAGASRIPQQSISLHHSESPINYFQFSETWVADPISLMISVPNMVGFVANPSTRGTIQIFWTSFSAIFICIWTSLHPAIPIPESMRSEDFVRKDLEHNKFALACVTLIFPESALAGIVADYMYATHIVQDVNSAIPECEWTMTDAYFAIMDGYHYQDKAITAPQILDHMQHGRLGVMRSNAASIMDRSKTGTLQKILACAQVVWLLLQCFVRRIVHLPMSSLEMGAAGYSIVALLAFGLQWNKPKDVGLPITLDPVPSRKSPDRARVAMSSPAGSRPQIWRKRSEGRADGTGTTTKQAWYGWEITFAVQGIACLVFGGWYFLAWNFSFPTVAELHAWRVACVLNIVPGFLASLIIICAGDQAEYRNVAALTLSRVHMASRLMLLVMMFIGLRRLPEGVFMTIGWTTLIPHI
ncbi:hypothetical protein EVG20_g3779 [Dentipellis fragilis]|uniref:F-box domain-containing protein n=1 Tax=Dentipellis fragilis TaxID=205917 RepID=A0A4Y9YZS5_9AGAM|nr:hypothetical protein EVG20_g3779 [Dentipellis fragilis]